VHLPTSPVVYTLHMLIHNGIVLFARDMDGSELSQPWVWHSNRFSLYMLVLVIAFRPQTPKHIRGGWSHYTDTSESVEVMGLKIWSLSNPGLEPPTFRSRIVPWWWWWWWRQLWQWQWQQRWQNHRMSFYSVCCLHRTMWARQDRSQKSERSAPKLSVIANEDADIYSILNTLPHFHWKP
jgi:hypothetical protein